MPKCLIINVLFVIAAANRSNHSSFLLVIACLLSTFSFAQKSKIIAKGATLQKQSGIYAFTEGPATDLQGNVYFTDQPNDKIYKWETNGNVSVFMDKTGRSNGLYFDKDDNLYACADLENQLWKIDKNKQISILVNDFEGKKLNGPNDLWIDNKGGIYFTDPYYQRSYWTRTKADLTEKRVYYLSPDRKILSIAAQDFVNPNGIIGSPDGKLLYVADIGASKTYVYDIDKDGKLQNRKLFASMGSDGMTMDNKGNIYLTGKGVSVFSKNGEKIETIAVDEPWTANITFGGKDRKTLFITASKSIYTLAMKVKGAR